MAELHCQIGLRSLECFLFGWGLVELGAGKRQRLLHWHDHLQGVVSADALARPGFLGLRYFVIKVVLLVPRAWRSQIFGITGQLGRLIFVITLSAGHSQGSFIAAIFVK